MIVVADSGPLHYLILLEEATLLPRFYGAVLVPQAVVRELTHAGAPPKVAQWMSAPHDWLRIESVTPDQLHIVSEDLDLGDREAIALAEAVHADLLLMDDAAGRAEARRRNLKVTGTLGVLRIAAEQGLIDVPTVIARLRKTNFYFNEGLIRSVFGLALTNCSHQVGLNPESCWLYAERGIARRSGAVA